MPALFGGLVLPAGLCWLGVALAQGAGGARSPDRT
jgi:hypothetical protein